jgi:hypothetical protein
MEFVACHAQRKELFEFEMPSSAWSSTSVRRLIPLREEFILYEQQPHLSAELPFELKRKGPVPDIAILIGHENSRK